MERLVVIVRIGVCICILILHCAIPSEVSGEPVNAPLHRAGHHQPGDDPRHGGAGYPAADDLVERVA